MLSMCNRNPGRFAQHSELETYLQLMRIYINQSATHKKGINLIEGYSETVLSLKATNLVKIKNNWYCLTICEDRGPTPETPQG